MYDLSFGDPVVVRNNLKSMHFISERNIGYRVNQDCEKEIAAFVRSYYRQYFNATYKHIILTHGATGAINAIVNAIKGSYDVFAVNDMSFSWYERILKKEQVNFTRKVEDMRNEKQSPSTFYIVDSPNNPWGHQILNPNLNPENVLWDSVYASPIYMNSNVLQAPKHKIMVGSFSKMFGLSGLRIGWAATNDDVLAAKVKELALTAECGLSAPSLDIARNFVESVDMPAVHQQGKLHLDFNREKFEKLSKIFSLKAPVDGMFYMGILDDKNKQILQKANVKGSELTSLAGTHYVRLNMADSYCKTKDAIAAILKADQV